MSKKQKASKKLMQQIMIVLVTISISAFGGFNEIKAQVLEIPTGSKMIHIGKNDLNTSWNNHTLNFGQGPNTSANAGLWFIGVMYEGLNIGKVSNTVGTGTALENSIYIKPDGRVGINYLEWAIPNTPGGKLFVDGDIYMNGNKVQIVSDRRYKRDIKPINNLDNLFKINSVQYKVSGEGEREKLELFKQNNKNNLEEERFNLVVSGFERKIVEKESDTNTYFGFIAQELREVFPNLVTEDDKGFLSVNYIGLIPVLVDAIKELNAKIEKLEGKNKETMPTKLSAAALYQNNPNPFTESTEIRYYIPDNTTNAVICIYDMVGGQIMKIDNLSRGYSSVTLHGNQLKAGMYMYSLFVDGKEIDTKRMILTDK